MPEPTPIKFRNQLRPEPQRSVIWLFVSPASVLLVGLHSIIVVAWYFLFRGPQAEMPVLYFVFVIDLVPMYTLDWLVERLLVYENGQFLYFVVMGTLGTVQWSCIGAAVTAVWRWFERDRIV
jgi:hypothetical protein